MYILEIILEGFKSYSARTVIEKFDPQFNAITGLNGSGKSNILDAICFVLGISQLANVRAEKLQELVYKAGNSGVTKASVTIMFDNTNKNQSPPGYTELDKISVTRTIENQKSKYYINGRTETAEKVKSLFCSVKLNVNNPHFLIMQGRVTKVINMKPIEILGLIEEAAGISLYQNKKEQTMNLIRKKDTKLQEINKILEEEVNPQLEALRKDKEDYALFKSNEGQIEEYDKILIAFDFWEKEKFVRGSNERESQIRNSIAKIERDIKLKNDEIDQLKVQITKIQNSSNTCSTEQEMKKSISNLENQILELQLEQERLQKEEQTFEQVRKKNIQYIDDLKQEVHKYTRLIQEIEEEGLVQTEKELEGKKETLRDLERELKLLKEGKQGESLQDSMHRAIQELENNLANTRNKKMQISNEIKLMIQRVMEGERELKFREEESFNFEQEKQTVIKKIQRIQNEIEEKKFALDQYGKVRDDKREVDRQMEEIDRELQQQHMAQASQLYNFRYKVPNEQFDRRQVCGKVVQLFKIKDPQRHTAALEAAAGGRLINVVVKNEKVSKELISNNCLYHPVTFIPLNRIQSEPIRPEFLEMIKNQTQGKARLAKELIEYDPEYESAMNYVFGNVFIAEDEQTAKSVAYNKMRSYLCVTLKGDKYNPQGTLEGGYSKQGGILSMVEKYKQVIEKRTKLAFSKDNLDKHFVELQKICKFLSLNHFLDNHVEELKNKLNLVQHELKLKEQRGDEQSSGQIDKAKLQRMKQDLDDLNHKLKRTNEKEASIAKEIETLKQEQKTFQQQGGNQKEKYFQDKIKAIQKEKDQLQQLIVNMRAEKNQHEIKIDEIKQEIITIESKLKDDESKLRKELSGMASIQQKMTKLEAELTKQKVELEKKEGERIKANQEVDSLLQKQRSRENAVENLKQDLKDNIDNLKQLDLKVKTAKSIIEELLNENKWIETEREFFGIAGHRYHFERMNISKIREDFEKIKEENESLRKRINVKVDAMFEKTEQQYMDLQRKKETTIENKQKFERTIAELDDLKNKEVERTWKAVDKYCSEIYSTLLQGAMAKLVPPEGKTVHDGLELKVGFSGAWKDSLSELSGGQRSLLALSLILALLKYHPAPVYILDEIDSALDLSHTQNIGIMIRKFFQNSQFVIVSLKEGLFQNANVLFKVSFVDSRSTVKRFQVRKNQTENAIQNSDNNTSQIIQKKKTKGNQDEDVEMITT